MNSFDQSIARALEKGWKEGARRMRMEKRMASGLIKACLSRGFTSPSTMARQWKSRSPPVTAPS